VVQWVTGTAPYNYDPLTHYPTVKTASPLNGVLGLKNYLVLQFWSDCHDFWLYCTTFAISIL